MIVEHAPLGRRGWYASFTLQGVQAGQIFAAAIFLPLAHYLTDDQFKSWGWRVPFLLSLIVIGIGYFIRREVDETPAFIKEQKRRRLPKAPIVEAFKHDWRNMARVTCMALMNTIPVVTTIFGAAYAVQPGYGIRFHSDVYLWIPVLGNVVAVFVIPFMGNLSDKIGRRPPIIVGALVSGLFSYGYLYAISLHNVPLAVVLSIAMWGVVYQGYNAVFPSFYPELFPTRTRVTAMAIAQNAGTTVTALLPVVFTTVAPPGSTSVPSTVGTITFAVTVVAAVAAWNTGETYRTDLEHLGESSTVPSEI
jgi:MFS family permease